MANETSKTPTPGQQPQTIPLSQIHDLPGVFIPKPVESKLGSMILSIQNSGVMEPVILRQRDDGEYQLLSGYRRRVASERAGKKDIPAFVYEMTMQEAVAYVVRFMKTDVELSSQNTTTPAIRLQPHDLTLTPAVGADITINGILPAQQKLWPVLREISRKLTSSFS